MFASRLVSVFGRARKHVLKSMISFKQRLGSFRASRFSFTNSEESISTNERTPLCNTQSSDSFQTNPLNNPLIDPIIPQQVHAQQCEQLSQQSPGLQCSQLCSKQKIGNSQATSRTNPTANPVTTSVATQTTTASIITTATTSCKTALADSNTSTTPSIAMHPQQKQHEQPLQSQQQYVIQTQVASQSQQILSQTAAMLENISSLFLLHLPPLDIKKFDGDFKKYEKFRLRFSTLISSIPSIYHATLLYKSLEDDVIDQLDHIPDLQALDAYQTLWQYLDAEFSRHLHGAMSHEIKLMSIKSWKTCESSAELLKLYKFVRYHYNALERSGRGLQAEAIKIFFLGKLSGEVADRAATLIAESGNQPVIPKLLSMIRDEVDILELQEFATVSSISQPEPVAITKPHGTYTASHEQGYYRSAVTSTQSLKYQGSMHSNSRFKPLCLFCKSSDHASFNCTHYSHPYYFRKILYEHRLCFNCFAQGHRSWECDRPTLCTKQCKDARKHSSVICSKLSSY